MKKAYPILALALLLGLCVGSRKVISAAGSGRGAQISCIDNEDGWSTWIQAGNVMGLRRVWAIIARNTR